MDWHKFHSRCSHILGWYLVTLSLLFFPIDVWSFFTYLSFDHVQALNDNGDGDYQRAAVSPYSTNFVNLNTSLVYPFRNFRFQYQKKETKGNELSPCIRRSCMLLLAYSSLLIPWLLWMNRCLFFTFGNGPSSMYWYFGRVHVSARST